MNVRDALGLPPRTRLESAIAKSELAIGFLTSARDNSIESGNRELRLVIDNALDAITELRLLAEEGAGVKPEARAVGEAEAVAWAPIHDRAEAIATSCVGATESQASAAFLKGWPGGWKQATEEGWRLGRVQLRAALSPRTPTAEGDHG